MPIKVTCSNCGGVLHAPDDAGGKRGRCPTCGNILPIPAAAAGSATELPDAPAASPGQRPPSFADFALGPQVGPPPGASAESPRGGNPGRSSIPFNSGNPDPAPPQRAKAPAERADAQRASDPFARKGSPTPVPKAATTGAPTEGTVKAWKKSRGGLMWVQAANFLLVVPVVLLPAYYIALSFKPDLLPDPGPGLFGVKDLTLTTAVPLFAVGGTVLLALLLNLFGRLGFAAAPKRSAVGGPAMLSALGTLIALCAGLATIYPNVFALCTGEPALPDAGGPLFAADSVVGLIQRVGLFAGVAAVAVGEFWFASAVGRVGSALADGKPAARATRYQMLLGLVLIGLVGTGAVIPGPQFGLWAPGYATRNVTEEFPRYVVKKETPERTVYEQRKQLTDNPAYEVGRETNEMVAGQWEKNVGPLFDPAGAYQSLIPPAVCLLVGLLVWLMHLRMVGAARGAMAGWLDAHGTAA